MPEQVEEFFALSLAACFILIALGIAKICQQRDTIAQQQTRIENFQNMVNSIPADYRTPEGKRLRP
jgi:hypothetical protein